MKKIETRDKGLAFAIKQIIHNKCHAANIPTTEAVRLYDGKELLIDEAVVHPSLIDYIVRKYKEAGLRISQYDYAS